MFLVKLLGVIDLVAAFVLLANLNLGGFGIFIWIILLGKGMTSLMADIVGKAYGIIDIIAGLMILFHTNINPAVGIIFFVFYIYKALFSLMPRG